MAKTITFILKVISKAKKILKDRKASGYMTKNYVIGNVLNVAKLQKQ